MSSFGMGDRVLIARKVNWISWVDPMDECVGKEGIVIDVTDSLIYGEYFRVRLQENGIRSIGWNYPPSALELVGDFLPGHGPGNRHIAQELPQ